MSEPKPPTYRFVRILVALAGLSFFGMVIWASLTGDFLQEFAVVAAMPWGQVSLVDLYLGFFLYALIVFLVEEKPLIASFWALPVFILGNFWAALWFVVRFPKIAGRFKTPSA